MKIHLIKKQTTEDYVKKNARSKASFEIWFSILKRANWKEPNEIIATFNSADILGRSSDRVIFNIGGNNYRMIDLFLPSSKLFSGVEVVISSNELLNL